MNRSSLIICLLFISVFLVACVKQEDTSRLDAQIEATKKQIAESENELKKYKEGAPLYSLVTLRASSYKQSLAMLEQKRASYLFYFKTSYQVNGSAYQPPLDLAEKLSKLKENLKNAKSDWEMAKKKAAGAGGLMAVVAVLEAETKGLTVAQLEYQVTAYENGFPPYMSPGDAVKIPEVEAVKDTAKLEKPSKQQDLSGVAPTKEQIEAEMLKTAVDVKLLQKKNIPSDYRNGRYEDLVSIELEYENKTEKEIRAFTGVTVFSDIFDRPFHRISLTVDDRIPPGKRIVDKGKTVKINKFSQEDQQLVAKEVENIKFSFEPKSILFSDGSHLGSVDK